ncbi:MAG: hypothetical protein LBR41_01905, partial [Rickettsiales bacterium]|nr:hypothetical protein [Rickettsiales bacterium]
MNDAIFALSSGHGKSGVAVVRVSGRDLSQILNSPLAGESQSRAVSAGDAVGGITESVLVHFRPPTGAQDSAADSPARGEFKARYAYLLDLRDLDNEIIDRGIVIYFPGPNSFTGQDVIEFHIHGAPAVVE